MDQTLPTPYNPPDPMPTQEVELPDNPEAEKNAIPKAHRAHKHIDWDVIGREYIYGVVRESKKGDFDRHYPSLREVARRFKIPHPTVGYYARKLNWGDRREKFREYLRSEFDREIAKARALSAADTLSIVDTYILRFKKAVEADAVGRSSMKDLDVAVRLKAFVQKEVDRSEDATATLNLAQLQARHARQREQAEQLTDPEVGFIPSRADREATALAAPGPAAAQPGDVGARGAAPGEAPAKPAAPTPADVAPKPAAPRTAAQVATQFRAGDGRQRGKPRKPRGRHSAARSSVLWSQAMRAAKRHAQALGLGWDSGQLGL